MRPVMTWKYAAAPPTLISDGPRPLMPCRLVPWQVMQLWSNSCRPADTEAAVSVESVAPDDDANAA